MKNLNMCIIIGALTLASSAYADHWELNRPAFTACRENAFKAIEYHRGNIGLWQANLDYTVRKLSEYKAEIESCNSSISYNKQQIAELETVLSTTRGQVQVLFDSLQKQRETLVKIQESRQSGDKAIPELILSIRNQLETSDAELDFRIATLMDLRDATEDVSLKAVFDIRIEQTRALKAFRIDSKSPENAKSLFEDFVSGKSNDALKFVSPVFEATLIKARAANLAYIKNSEALDVAERNQSEQVRTTESELSAKRNLRDSLYTYTIPSLNNILEQKYRQKTTAIENVGKAEAGIVVNTDGLNWERGKLSEWQKEYDVDCHSRHSYLVKDPKEPRDPRGFKIGS